MALILLSVSVLINCVVILFIIKQIQAQEACIEHFSKSEVAVGKCLAAQDKVNTLFNENILNTFKLSKETSDWADNWRRKVTADAKP